jgi:transposase
VQIVLLYAQGKGAVEIARVLGCGVSTATRVARTYRAEGDLAFEDGRRHNGQSVIDDDLLQALAEQVAQSPQDYGWDRPTWTAALLACALAKIAGVCVSPTTIRRMLHRLGARWGMPKPVVACPWSKARKTRRLRQIKRTLDSLPPGEVAYYADEVDIHLNPKIGRDWMLRSEQKKVLTPGQNKKRYVAGALSTDGRRLVFVEWHRKNSDLFILLLARLKAQHPNAVGIHVVLDNCATHSSKKLRTFLRCHEDLFVLHFLPPYCPDHNKIERLWRDLHANVTRNHRCKTIGELMKQVRRYLEREAKMRREKGTLRIRRNSKRTAA